MRVGIYINCDVTYVRGNPVNVLSLQLFDSNQQLITSSTDEPGLCKIIYTAKTDAPDDTYYLAINAVPGPGGQYGVQMSNGSLSSWIPPVYEPFTFEPNDTIATAAPIESLYRVGGRSATTQTCALRQ